MPPLARADSNSEISFKRMLIEEKPTNKRPGSSSTMYRRSNLALKANFLTCSRRRTKLCPYLFNRTSYSASSGTFLTSLYGVCNSKTLLEVVMRRFALSILFCVLSGSVGFAQTKPAIEGVWKITEWIESGKTNTNPQPGLIIFTRGYYSVAHLMGPPRTDSIPSNMGREPSDAEKIGLYEQWKWFVGISGSYEVKGSTVLMRPIVAQATWHMNKQTPREHEFKLEGSNTFWLIPAGAKKVGLRMKL